MQSYLKQPTVLNAGDPSYDSQASRLRRLSRGACSGVAPGRLTRRLRDVFFLLTLGVLATTSVQANPFYVSPTGNDSHSGTEAQPFRTIERARTAARAATPGQNQDVTVIIRGGRYELSDTLRFDGNDSGRNGHRVIYRSAPGEHVSISGGRRVTGWTSFRDGIFRAPSPVPAYRQLYANGQPQVRARTPNTGFHRLQRWDGDKSIVVDANHIHNWSNLGQVEMVVMKHWNHSRFRIGSFHKSGASASIYPKDPERSVEWIVQWPNREGKEAYYFENSLDLLDQSGEWYLDRGQQQVYYKPKAGEDINNVEIIVPRLGRLLEVRGASNLHFVGLTFEHSNWTDIDNEGFVGIQAGSYRVLATGKIIPSAIYLESTQNVRLERNVVRNLGNGGIELGHGTYQTQIIGNALADVAGNGIAVYTLLSDRNPADHIRCRNDIIRNNYLVRIGLDYPGAVGIFASYPAGLTVEHNEITDLPYTAINLGWGWTNLETGTRDNTVRYNRIHNVMNLLDDGAGIYTLSKQHNTLIEENYISNMVRSQWAGYYEIAGLYLDEQSENITLRNNVVEQLSGVTVWKQNRSNTNHIYNNGSGIPNQQAIIDKAGLQSDFRAIRNLVSGGPAAPSAEKGPFGGTAATFPGRVEAENFDHGGPGVAYNDSTSSNQGGQHRPAEQVDIEACSDQGGGHNVGWTTSGEWLQYTVDVKETGSYDLHFRVASTSTSGNLRLLVDGTEAAGAVAIPNTGGWQQWQTISVENVSLAKGERILRIQIDGGSFNFNYFEAEPGLANLAPVVAITSPAADATFNQGETINIAATASHPDGSIVRLEFFAGDTKLGEKMSAPFTFAWQNAAAGAFSLTARATDLEGNTTVSTPVQITVSPKASEPGPYSGAPATLPGRIEAEDFDKGGSGVAYFDTTSTNQGGAYRPSELVDVEATADAGGGFNVGWTRPTEWLQYTVDIQETGTYDLTFRVASSQADRSFHVTIDGGDVTGSINVPNTQGWQNWQTITVADVRLEAGARALRLEMDTGEFNLNWFEAVVKAAEHPSSTARRPFNDTAAPIPGQIDAVEFDHGGPGIAYEDTTSVNSGGAFRSDEEVDIEASEGESFSHNVGWVAAGEWLEYTVKVAEAGRYQVNFRVASTMSGGHLSLSAKGKDVTGRIDISNTGGWQQWATVSAPEVELAAGEQVLRLVIGAGEFNIGSIGFHPVASQNFGLFADWQQGKFTVEEQQNAAISGPTADPDGDGVPNLLEYAFEKNPTTPNRENLPEPGEITLSGEKYLTINYTRRAGATDLNFIVEVSGDMKNWTSASNAAVPVSVTPEGDIERVVVRDAQPLGQSPQRFLRLRVEQASGS